MTLTTNATVQPWWTASGSDLEVKTSENNYVNGKDYSLLEVITIEEGNVVDLEEKHYLMRTQRLDVGCAKTDVEVVIRQGVGEPISANSCNRGRKVVIGSLVQVPCVGPLRLEEVIDHFGVDAKQSNVLAVYIGLDARTKKSIICPALLVLCCEVGEVK